MIQLVIKFTKNNIHINISKNGFTFYKLSLKGFKKRNVNLISQYINDNLNSIINKINPLIKINVFISGYHPTTYRLVKTMPFFNSRINQIFFISKKSFNGCRKKKERRLLIR